MTFINSETEFVRPIKLIVDNESLVYEMINEICNTGINFNEISLKLISILKACIYGMESMHVFMQINYHRKSPGKILQISIVYQI